MNRLTDIGRLLLRRYIQQRGQFAGNVSEALGHHRSWLPKVLRGKLQLTLEHIEAVLDEIEVSPADFFADCLSNASAGLPPSQEGVVFQRPEYLLKGLLHSDSDEIERVPGLDRWRERAQLPPSPGASFDLDRRVQEIDDLREHDADAAIVEAKLWLDQLYKRCAQRRLEAQDAVRVASALGVWASALRVRGHIEAAARVLLEAFTLHGRATSSPTYADLLERLTLLLRDAGYSSWALDPIQRAYAIFEISEIGAREARALLVMGLIHVYLGHSEQAERVFLRCLEHKDADLIRRAGAAINLVVTYEKAGRLEKASTVLQLIERNQDLLPQTWRSAVQGARGRILHQQGLPTEASRHLYLALSVADGHIAPCSQFLLALDLAAVLVDLGHFRELRELAASQSRLLAR